MVLNIFFIAKVWLDFFAVKYFDRKDLFAVSQTFLPLGFFVCECRPHFEDGLVESMKLHNGRFPEMGRSVSMQSIGCSKPETSDQRKR